MKNKKIEYTWASDSSPLEAEFKEKKEEITNNNKWKIFKNLKLLGCDDIFIIILLIIIIIPLPNHTKTKNQPKPNKQTKKQYSNLT